MKQKSTKTFLSLHFYTHMLLFYYLFQSITSDESTDVKNTNAKKISNDNKEEKSMITPYQNPPGKTKF